MYAMFADASLFDQNIGDWNVGNVTNMSFMFYIALAFDQNLSSWVVNQVTDYDSMFVNSPMEVEDDHWPNFPIGWSAPIFQNYRFGWLQTLNVNVWHLEWLVRFGWAVFECWCFLLLSIYVLQLCFVWIIGSFDFWRRLLRHSRSGDVSALGRTRTANPLIRRQVKSECWCLWCLRE